MVLNIVPWYRSMFGSIARLITWNEDEYRGSVSAKRTTEAAMSVKITCDVEGIRCLEKRL